MTDSNNDDPILFDTEFPTCREGVFTPSEFATPEQIVDLVCLAEDLGYHAVWGTDFIAPQADYGISEGETPNWYELLTTLAYCAARTETIKLGTGLLLAPLRDPVITAKQVATIDRFSGGRMLLGLGLGMSIEEFRALKPRLEKPHRGSMLDETIDLLRRLFSDAGPIDHAGDYYELNGVELNPKPLQSPFPIYVVCRSDRAYDRIIRWGLNITGAAPSIPGHVAALGPLMEAVGRDPGDLDAVAEGEVFLGATPQQAIDRYQSTRHGQWRLGRQSLDDVLAGNWIGTVEQIIDSIGRLIERGVRHFYLLHIPADTLQQRIEILQQFAEEVMPALVGSTVGTQERSDR